MTESPTVTASRLGLAWRRGGSTGTITLDQLLDLAVSQYWAKRCERAKSKEQQRVSGVAKRASSRRSRENVGSAEDSAAPAELRTLTGATSEPPSWRRPA